MPDDDLWGDDLGDVQLPGEGDGGKRDAKKERPRFGRRKAEQSGGLSDEIDKLQEAFDDAQEARERDAEAAREALADARREAEEREAAAKAEAERAAAKKAAKAKAAAERAAQEAAEQAAERERAAAAAKAERAAARAKAAAERAMEAQAAPEPEPASTPWDNEQESESAPNRGPMILMGCLGAIGLMLVGGIGLVIWFVLRVDQEPPAPQPTALIEIDGSELPQVDPTPAGSGGAQPVQVTAVVRVPAERDWTRPWTERITETAAGSARTVVTINGVELGLRWIPPGTGTLGSPEGEEGRHEDEAQRPITVVRGFWMSEDEISGDLWKAVTGNGDGGDQPVYGMSWKEADDFTAVLAREHGLVGARLPRDTEWEYAARAGSFGPFGISDPTRIVADLPRGAGPRPVGSGVRNAWGLSHMHGNVAEWTMNQVPAADGSRPFRGGAWYSYLENCRSARQYRRNGGSAFPGAGLRIVIP